MFKERREEVNEVHGRVNDRKTQLHLLGRRESPLRIVAKGSQ